MIKKIIIILIILIISIISFNIYISYRKIFSPNIITKNKKSTYIYIPTGSTFNDLLQILSDNNLLKNRTSFIWVAEKKKFKKIRPGRYLIKNGMNNNELINLLRSGMQSPVNVTINVIRNKEELASSISKQIEADSISLINLLNDNKFLKKYGFTSENVLSMFLPDTYEFYWNTDALGFFKRMNKEYKKFWNDELINKAKKINLSPIEISILASIVQLETSKEDEMPLIAGVYLNRLKKGMRLEADPTLLYASNDFNASRVLEKHKKNDSPYNTYKYSGLPPGPICTPYKSTIKAVLNYKKHNYLYFCAKEDFSGYHNFATTYSQHINNAIKYRKELNKRKIFK